MIDSCKQITVSIFHILADKSFYRATLLFAAKMIAEQWLQIFYDNLIRTILNKKWSKHFHINTSPLMFFLREHQQQCSKHTGNVRFKLFVFSGIIHTIAYTITHIMASQHIALK